MKEKEREAKAKKDRIKVYKKSLNSSKLTDTALSTMIDRHGSPDTKLLGFIGTDTDKNDMLEIVSKARVDYEIPDNISAKWIKQLTPVYSNDDNDYITRWGVTEDKFEKAYLEKAKEYALKKKK